MFSFGSLGRWLRGYGRETTQEVVAESTIAWVRDWFRGKVKEKTAPRDVEVFETYLHTLERLHGGPAALRRFKEWHERMQGAPGHGPGYRNYGDHRQYGPFDESNSMGALKKVFDTFGPDERRERDEFFLTFCDLPDKEKDLVINMLTSDSLEQGVRWVWENRARIGEVLRQLDRAVAQPLEQLAGWCSRLPGAPPRV